MYDGEGRKVAQRRRRLFFGIEGFAFVLGRYRDRQPMGNTFGAALTCAQIDRNKRNKRQRRAPIEMD
jgi:hypothetical protein